MSDIGDMMAMGLRIYAVIGLAIAVLVVGAAFGLGAWVF